MREAEAGGVVGFRLLGLTGRERGADDDRVVPAHSFKYAATLQEKQGHGPNPVLIRIETNTGHGAGMSMTKRMELMSDLYSFAWYNMGIIPDVAKKAM